LNLSNEEREEILQIARERERMREQQEERAMMERGEGRRTETLEERQGREERENRLRDLANQRRNQRIAQAAREIAMARRRNVRDIREIPSNLSSYTQAELEEMRRELPIQDELLRQKRIEKRLEEEKARKEQEIQGRKDYYAERHAVWQQRAILSKEGEERRRREEEENKLKYEKAQKHWNESHSSSFRASQAAREIAESRRK
jgi:hypothetical protein